MTELKYARRLPDPVKLRTGFWTGQRSYLINEATRLLGNLEGEFWTKLLEKSELIKDVTRLLGPDKVKAGTYVSVKEPPVSIFSYGCV